MTEMVTTPPPHCPSCSQPIKRGFRLNNTVKTGLALLLVGYAVLSVMIFLAGTPTGEWTTFDTAGDVYNVKKK